MWEKCSTYYEENIACDLQQIMTIERSTRLQRDCEDWFLERRKRLTASNFGSICKRRESTKVNKLLERLLYSKGFLNTESINHGIMYKKHAIDKYMKDNECVVHFSGLVVNYILPLLACSPDGIIICGPLPDILLEVKCSFIAKTFTLDDFINDSQQKLAKNKKLQFLKYDYESSEIQILSNHDYYFQIQGSLFIKDLQCCYLLVYASQTTVLLVIPVLRDKDFIDIMV